jgi:predicted nucleic acid-binding protein
MDKVVVFDTSILVENLRTGSYGEQIAAVKGVVRMSSVVLAELWSGASTAVDLDIMDALQGSLPVLTPTEKDWSESGRLLPQIGAEKRLEPSEVRDLHMDVLIALTVRGHKAKLITANGKDFKLIRKHLEFELEVW